MRRSLAIIFVIIFALGDAWSFGSIPVAHAAVPELLSHQGRLLDGSGNLLGGTGTDYCFKFSFYDDATIGGGDAKLWPTGLPSTMTAEVKQGVFNVLIGDTSAGGNTLDFDFSSTDTIFLQTEVAELVGPTCDPGDGAESFETLSPRQQIGSSGYAINSKTVGGFTPAQSATGDDIPVLTSGNLILGDTNPELNATGSNTLTLQSGVTGNLQFFSASNAITSGGALSIAGNFDTAGTIQAGSGNTTITTATGALDADALGLISGDGAGSNSNGSGLETDTDRLGLLQGCADNEILKWNDVGSVWTCATDASGGGGGTLDDAYTNGGTITVDSGNVLLDLSDATNDYHLTLDNTSAGAIGTALAITSTGGGSSITTAIDLSAAGIDTAIAIGGNDVTVGGATLSSAEFALLDNGVALSELTNSGTLTATTVDINGGAVDGTAIGASSPSTGAFTTLSSTGATTLGNNSATVAINSSDWDIDATGAITGVSFDANGTGNSISNIDNADLTNSSVTVTAGTGLANGGSVSLGGTTTLNVASANGGIVANADNIALTVAPSADALSANTSSGSGLEIVSSGLALLQGCADTEILKWDETSDVWACATDSGSGGTPTLDDAYTAGATITVDAGDVLLNLSDATNDYKFTIDNTSAGAIATGFAITSTGGGSSITTAIDVSASAIGTALALGSNDVTVGGATLSSAELALLDGGVTLGELTDSGTLTATTVDINGGAIDGTAIGASSASTGAFTTLASTGVTTLGNNSATVAINSSDWDIDATGAITNVSFDANGTGNSISNIDDADLTNDTVDFDKIADSLNLDAGTTVTGGAGKTFTFARTLTDATTENGLLINTTASDTTSGTSSQFGLYLDNLASTEALDASLVIDNSDADDVIGTAIKIVDAGGGFTSIIDNAGTLISGTELNRLDGKDANLVDTNDAVAIAITGTGALNAGSITGGFGAIDTGADNITTTGTVFGNTFDRSTAGALSIGTGGASAATSIALGSSSVTSLTVTTDGTGTAEVALPAGSIDGTEILNDTVALTTDTSGNYVASLTAGAGLTGDVASEGSTPTLAVVSGNGAIVANADDITLTVAPSANGLSSTTSSGSGLEVVSTGLALLQGCADTEILKWDETSDVWACAADATGGGGGALDTLTAATTDDTALTSGDNTIEWDWALTSATSKAFTIGESSASTGGSGDQHILKLSTLATSTAGPLEIVSNSADSGDIEFNLASAGDFDIKDNGTTFATFTDAGGITFTPNGTSDLVLNEAAGVNFQVTATAAPTVDLAAITNAGQGTTTDGVNGLSISFVTGDGTNPTNDGLKIAATSGGTAAGDVLNGIELTLSGTSGTENGINFGTGWDSLIKGTTAGTNLLSFTNFSVTSAGAATFGGASSLTLGTSSSATGAVIFKNATNTNTATIQSGVTSSSYTWTLPTADSAGCLTSNGSGTLSIATCGDVHIDTVAATGTWTKPSGAVMVIVELWGAGGGGGGGAGGGTGTIETGGGGGGGGAYNTEQFVASNLGSSVEVTIGAGGTAGTAGSSGVGGDGGVGGTTCFSTTTGCAGTMYLQAFGGGGGAHGGTAATTGGGGGGGGAGSAGSTATVQTGATGGGPNGGSAGTDTAGFSGAGGGSAGSTPAVGGSGTYGGSGGGASSTTGGAPGSKGGSSVFGAGGGGGGGSCAVTTCTARAGGQGGDSSTTVVGGGGAGGTAGGAGTAGNASPTEGGGQGGGGGANNASGTGGAGGDGGVRGGGAGGGGGGETTTGGAGGTGGAGYVRIYTYKGSGADLAEMYATNDPSIAPGDVVALDPSLQAGVKKTTRAYDPTAFGIISTSPSLVMGSVEDENAAGGVLVALAGRVPVKVSAENGDILPGDLLTPSSVPGVAMKATKAGQVIGQAMSTFTTAKAEATGDPIGLVLAFIKTDYANGSTSPQLVSGLTETTTTPTDAVATLTELVRQEPVLLASDTLSEVVADRVTAGLEIITPRVVADRVETNTLAPVSGNLAVDLGVDGTFSIVADGTTVADDGTISAAPVTVARFDAAGNATFSGTLTAASINAESIAGLDVLTKGITDELTTLGQRVSDAEDAITGTSSLLDDQSALLNNLSDRILALEQRPSFDLSALELTGGLTVQGAVTFTDTLTLFGKTIFVGRPYVNADTAGFATIHAGDTEVSVAYADEYLTEPVVNVSPSLEDGDDLAEQENAYLSDSVRYAITDNDTRGFTIHLARPAPFDMRFGWIALAVQDARQVFSLSNEPLAPEPVVEPVVEPEPTPEPEPVIEPLVEPEPIVETEPEPEATTEPDPVIAEPEPEPVVDPVTEPSEDPSPTDNPDPSTDTSSPAPADTSSETAPAAPAESSST